MNYLTFLDIVFAISNMFIIFILIILCFSKSHTVFVGTQLDNGQKKSSQRTIQLMKSWRIKTRLLNSTRLKTKKKRSDLIQYCSNYSERKNLIVKLTESTEEIAGSLSYNVGSINSKMEKYLIENTHQAEIVR